MELNEFLACGSYLLVGIVVAYVLLALSRIGVVGFVRQVVATRRLPADTLPALMRRPVVSIYVAPGMVITSALAPSFFVGLGGAAWLGGADNDLPSMFFGFFAGFVGTFSLLGAFLLLLYRLNTIACGFASASICFLSSITTVVSAIVAGPPAVSELATTIAHLTGSSVAGATDMDYPFLVLLVMAAVFALAFAGIGCLQLKRLFPSRRRVVECGLANEMIGRAFVCPGLASRFIHSSICPYFNVRITDRTVEAAKSTITAYCGMSIGNEGLDSTRSLYMTGRAVLDGKGMRYRDIEACWRNERFDLSELKAPPIPGEGRDKVVAETRFARTRAFRETLNPG